MRAAIDCLRKANSTDMVYKEWDGITVGLTIGIFTPIIDGSFLDEKPAVSLKKKEFKKTNILKITVLEIKVFIHTYRIKIPMYMYLCR